MNILAFSIIIYLIGSLLIGYWASLRVKTSGDFLLAGRNLPLFLSSFALFATWFGAETIFGATSEFIDKGLIGVIEDPFGGALCFLLYGLFFAKPLYRLNILTLSDLFKLKFGKKVEFISAIFLVPSYFGYVAAQLVALSFVLHLIFPVTIFQGIIIGSVLATFYTLLGGMWSISVTDFVQSLVIIVGLLIVSISLFFDIKDLDISSQLITKSLQFFPNPNSEIKWSSWLATWAVLGLGSIPSQDIFQRTMSSKSENVARNSCFYGAGLYLIFAMLPLFIGFCIKVLDFPVGDDLQLGFPKLILDRMPVAVQIMFFGALISAILSTVSAAILAPASIIAENLIKPNFKKSISDRKLLMYSRISVLFVALVSSILANFENNIFQLVAQSSIISMVTLLAPMWAAIYAKNKSELSMIVAMLIGFLSWICLEYIFEITFPSFIIATLLSFLTVIFFDRILISKNLVR